jgi:hypothetical protein
VIESKEFYKLFSILKKRLDLQNISHPTAGEFLRTIKTLMAKIKVSPLCCFEYFSQESSCRPTTGERFLVCHSIFLSVYLVFIIMTETMAEHRAKSLAALLPTALATGFSETEPQLEPLKVP